MNKIVLELTLEEALFVYGQIAKDLEYYETTDKALEILNKLEDKGVKW